MKEYRGLCAFVLIMFSFFGLAFWADAAEPEVAKNLREVLTANRLMWISDVPGGKFDLNFLEYGKSEKNQDTLGFKMVAISNDYVAFQNAAQTRFIPFASIRQFVITKEIK